MSEFVLCVEIENVSETFSQVIELLKLEAKAIERAAERLDEIAVVRAVDLLNDCCSKVIVTGVGKSGVIAQKIAQTMTSTGTIAVFVHPSDALHGGLGVVIKGDVVVALSNSGESDELLTILPTLKNREVSIIAVVGNLDSTLARCADVALDASVDKEACPLNLAPTASTTVALAIGDALAVALMRRKNLTAADFALNHPAGRLGKRLTLTVADLMHASPNVAPEATWLETISAISRNALGAVNIVDENTRLLGIVTDGDVRRTIERTAPENLANVTGEKMMTKNPIVAEPEMLAYDALRLMEDRPRQIAVLPIVDARGLCIGLLRLHDIVRSGL